MDPDFAVLGLGNPGERYRDTRHNIGFWCVEALARRWAGQFAADPELRGSAWSASVRLCGVPVLLVKPRTYMNRSGTAVAAIVERHGLEPSRLAVVYDEADLDLGRIRVRGSGSAGGHRGMRSIIETLEGQAFPRVRLGVRGRRRGERELADYVLESFDAEELESARALAELGADAIETVISDGVSEAMNRFNGKEIDVPGPDNEAPAAN